MENKGKTWAQGVKVTVIGGGPGGYVAAMGAAQAGAHAGGSDDGNLPKGHGKTNS